MAISVNLLKRLPPPHDHPSVTQIIFLKTWNAPNEETPEVLMIIAVQHDENKEKVRSEGPVSEVKALNKEAEPNKKFGKLLTLLLA